MIGRSRKPPSAPRLTFADLLTHSRAGAQREETDGGSQDYVRANTPERILEAYPDLSLAQVHAALAYYYDHPDEIEETLKAEEGWDERHERRKAEALARRVDK